MHKIPTARPTLFAARLRSTVCSSLPLLNLPHRILVVCLTFDHCPCQASLGGLGQSACESVIPPGSACQQCPVVCSCDHGVRVAGGGIEADSGVLDFPVGAYQRSTWALLDHLHDTPLEFGEFEGHGHGLNLLGSGGGATEQLLDLGHPGPHGVPMDAEFGGDSLPGSPGADERLQSRQQLLPASGSDQLTEEAVDEAFGHRSIDR